MFHVMKALPIATLLWATSADAMITVFTDRSAFLDAVGPSGVDDFNDLRSGRINGPLTRLAGDFGYTATITTAFFGAGAGEDRWLSSNSQSDLLVFSGFTGGVRAIGGDFFGTNFSGGLFVNANNAFTLVDASTSLQTSRISPGATSFLGFVSSEAITSLSVVRNGTSHFPTLNNLVLAGAPMQAVVPEPGSWALLISGFGLTGAALRRRRRLALG